MATLESIQGARRLIGFAVSQEPELIVSETNFRNYVSTDATETVLQKAEQQPFFQKHPVAKGTIRILQNGIEDIFHMVEHVRDQFNGENFDDKLQDIFRQPETIATISKHSRLPTKVLQKVMYSTMGAEQENEKSFILDQRATTLLTGPEYDFQAAYYPPDSNYGCPVGTPKENGELDPLFVSFSIWAADVSILGLRKITTSGHYV